MGLRNCEDVPDTHGHGTFIANVMLGYAPDAHLYVIKVTDKDERSLNTRTVKERKQPLKVLSYC